MNSNLKDYFVPTNNHSQINYESHNSLYDDIIFDSFNSANTKTMHCESCQIDYSDASHITSISHQTKKLEKSHQYNHYPVQPDNVGYKLLKKAGWDGNSGLGANEQGRTHPLRVTIKHDKLGIGLKSKHVPLKAQNPKGITKRELKNRNLEEESKAQRLNLLFSNRSDFERDYLDQLLFGGPALI